MAMMVFLFGLRWPTTSEDDVREQMWLAHVYRNKLVEIERGRRDAIRRLMAESGLRAFEEAAERTKAAAIAAGAAVKASRAASRTRKVDEGLLVAQREARAASAAAHKVLAQERMKLREGQSIQGQLDDIQERAKELHLSARKYSGLYSGTYDLVDSAARAAQAAPLYDGTEPNDPPFERWSGEGSIGVQIPNGMPSGRLFAGSHTQLRVDPVSPAAWSSPVRGERRRLSRTTLRVRVRSEDRAPVWAEFPMIMHQPIPEGGVVKRAAVHLRRIGPREEWTVTMTVDLPQVLRHGQHGHGAVAVDLGWRMIDGDLRVALWRGEDGAQGEVRLPADLLSALRKPDELRSVRDRSFDAAREALVKGLDAAPSGAVPAWLVEATATLRQWRGIGRLAALTLRWEQSKRASDAAAADAWVQAQHAVQRALRGLERTRSPEAREAWTGAVEAAAALPFAEAWPGERDLLEALEAWRYHDHHLWQWESDQRKKALRRRRELYRVAGAQLARRYKTLVLEAFDLRELARLPDVGEADGGNGNARSNRQLAAPGEARLVMAQSFASRGGERETAPTPDSTRECHVCHHVNTWNAAKMLRHVCEACKVEWDQDENAAANLLARWLARPTPERPAPDPDATPTPDAAPLGRWAKARQLGEQRQARQAAKGGASADDDAAAE